MNKSDINELKKRFTKKGCTITRICGRYVDSEKQTVVDLDENFLNLEEEELFKYLDIAKKVLSGTVRNNILELPFPSGEEEVGGHQQFLLGIRESRLKNKELLDVFYDRIIESYELQGHYLILLMHDAYDVMKKTTDGGKLDESEEVFEYILCAICPVTLSKPALGYRADENRIGSRIRDWVVDAPVNGFVFPAFSDRSADIHNVMYYTKNARDKHPELMEKVIGCNVKPTVTEQKDAFRSIVKGVVDDDTPRGRNVVMKINDEINTMYEDALEPEQVAEPVIPMTADTIRGVMDRCGVPQNMAERITADCAKAFEEYAPTAQDLVDKKEVESFSHIKKEAELQKEVMDLRTELKSTSLPEDVTVSVKLDPDRADSVRVAIFEGQSCLVIPVDEDDIINVNGEEI